jgi:hypothetical protein
MKQKIRSEREYWESREEAERLERSASWSSLTNDEKNRLAQLSFAIEQYEFSGTRCLNYVEAR